MVRDDAMEEAKAPVLNKATAEVASGDNAI